MRFLRPLLIAAVLLALPSAACRRRAAGTCADHVDCDPGFDCVDHRCARRMPVGGPGGPGTPAVDAEVPAPPEPVFPPRASDDSPPASPAPALPAPAPARKAPAPSAGGGGNATGDSPSPAAPGGRQPLWQQRRKNF